MKRPMPIISWADDALQSKLPSTDLISIYYVYKTTELETGRYYFGKRHINTKSVFLRGEPCYIGSGRWPAFLRKDGRKVSKHILFATRGQIMAEKYEMNLIRYSVADPLCMNIDGKSHMRKSLLGVSSEEWEDHYARHRVDLKQFSLHRC